MALVIRVGLLVDGTGAAPRRDAAIAIEGEKIAYVGPAAGAPPAEEDIDARDATAIPGLIDGHCHVLGLGNYYGKPPEDSDPLHLLRGAGAAQTALALGITGLGDCGSRDGAAIHLRDAIDRGYLVGPRVYACGGAITTTAGHGDYLGISSLADTADELRREVRRWVRAGADFIKIMATGGSSDPPTNRRRAQYTAEELRAGVEDAHRLGKRVVAHCNGTEGIRNAVDAGVDAIAHCNWLGAADGIVEYDDALARRMGEAGTMVDLNGGGLGSLRPGEGEVVGWTAGPEPARRWDIIAHTRRAYGVRVYLTTDGFGAGLAKLPEVLRRVIDQTELSALEVIHMATLAPAIGLGVERTVGSLEVGKLADVALLDGDALAEPGALARPRRVIKGGATVALAGNLLPTTR